MSTSMGLPRDPLAAFGPLNGGPRATSLSAMKKRVVTSVLWLYAGWYVGAMTAFLVGLSPVLGPIVGISAAVLIAIDPRHVLWSQPLSAPAVAPTRAASTSA